MKYRYYVVLLMFLVLPVQAVASFISMATEFQVVEKDGALTLEVKTENRGDEAAYDVQFESFVAGKRMVGPSVQSTGVNEKYKTEFLLEGMFVTSGRYPVVVRTRYKDANGYPFSALIAGVYDYRIAVLSDISISSEVATLPLVGMVPIKFIVRNSGNSASAIKLRLYLPIELASGNQETSVTLAPKTTEEVSFELENFSALENSTYQVILIAEYSDGEERLSSVGGATIRVVGAALGADWIVWLVVVCGGLIFVAVFVWMSARRTKA